MDKQTLYGNLSERRKSEVEQIICKFLIVHKECEEGLINAAAATKLLCTSCESAPLRSVKSETLDIAVEFYLDQLKGC